jgi:hypothetical protein
MFENCLLVGPPKNTLDFVHKFVYFLDSEQWRNKTSQALQTMIGKRQVNPADINCLYELYVKHGPKDALPLDYIHDPVFIGKDFIIC